MSVSPHTSSGTRAERHRTGCRGGPSPTVSSASRNPPSELTDRPGCHPGRHQQRQYEHLSTCAFTHKLEGPTEGRPSSSGLARSASRMNGEHQQSTQPRARSVNARLARSGSTVRAMTVDAHPAAGGRTVVTGPPGVVPDLLGPARPPSGGAIPTSTPTAASPSCGRASTPASTPAATSTSTTPAAASTPTSQLRDHLALLSSAVLGNPHSTNPTSLAATELAERGPRRRARLLQRPARRVHRRLHPQRQRRAQAGRRGLPVRAGRPLPAERRQPQLGQRHPRVRPRARGARPPTSRSRRRSCAWTRAALRAELDRG